MKVIHGSLKGLLQEVKDKKVDTVRVAAFMQSDVVTNGLPRYTAWVVVTALLDWISGRSGGSSSDAATRR
jgi:hypothetical protein